MDKPIILFKVVNSLNIGVATAIEVLEEGGFIYESKPATKISREAYMYLCNHLRVQPKIIQEEQRLKEIQENGITSYAVLENLRKQQGSLKRVFKYFAPNENSLDGLKHRYLYHSKFSSFNDPFDCNLNLIDFRKGAKHFNGTKDAFALKLDRIGICCFTTVKDSILMWSHYAMNHQGFCLEFHMGDQMDSIHPVNVMYMNKFIKANYHKHNIDAISHLIYSKSECWRYEEELRTLKVDINNDEDRKVKFQTSDLMSVYLGANCFDKVEMEIRTIVSDVYDGIVKIYKARLSANSFSLEWDELMRTVDEF